MHGRLRARSGSVVARRHPARLQRQAPGARHGRASSRSWKAPSGASRRSPTRASTGSSTGPRRSRPTTSSSSASPRSRGFFVAAGFSAHGIAGAGGIGRQVATWIVDGEPELDLWKMDIRRFGPAYRSQALHARAVDRELRDLLRHPLPERGAPGRSPLRMSPTYQILEELGASFGEKSGWERPNWFESNAADGDEACDRAAGPASTGRRRSAPRRWRRGERPACSTRRRSPSRDRRAGAVAFLQSMCANDVDVPVGRIVYTQLLNRRGGIECDLTVDPGRRPTATC